MYRIAICDDEKIHLDTLERTIRQSKSIMACDPEIQRFEKGEDLIKAVRKGAVYKFIFLDINMPEKNGLDVYEELEITKNTKVIFVSTHAEKLPEVFSLKTPYFLHKPYDVDTLSRTADAIEKHGKEEYILTYFDDEKKRTVSSKEIRYIQVFDHSIIAFTDKILELGRGNLEDYANTLKPFGFFRSHRSYLINFYYYDRLDEKNVYLIIGEKTKGISLSKRMGKR